MTTESGKVDLPLAASPNAQLTINTCTEQSAVIKECAAYANTPPVQAATVDMDTAIGTLQATVTKIALGRTALAALEQNRGTQLGTLHIKHDTLEAALNAASNGDPGAAQAWTGKTKVRAKPVPVSAATNPPEDAAVKVVKSVPGCVKASCLPEAGAVCYLFQQGGDPLHPETWAAAAMMKGHTFTVHNQPIGQLVYFRIAIVRRGSVQSQWTPVLQVLVH